MKRDTIYSNNNTFSNFKQFFFLNIYYAKYYKGQLHFPGHLLMALQNKDNTIF